MIRPSLTSNIVLAYRLSAGVDREGMPLTTWDHLATFRGGFGAASAAKQTYLGADGQRVDAIISTQSPVDIHIGDRIDCMGRTWIIVGIARNLLTRRILLSQWASK